MPKFLIQSQDGRILGAVEASSFIVGSIMPELVQTRYATDSYDDLYAAVLYTILSKDGSAVAMLEAVGRVIAMMTRDGDLESLKAAAGVILTVENADDLCVNLLDAEHFAQVNLNLTRTQEAYGAATPAFH